MLKHAAALIGILTLSNLALASGAVRTFGSNNGRHHVPAGEDHVFTGSNNGHIVGEKGSRITIHGSNNGKIVTEGDLKIHGANNGSVKGGTADVASAGSQATNIADVALHRMSEVQVGNVYAKEVHGVVENHGTITMTFNE